MPMPNWTNPRLLRWLSAKTFCRAFVTSTFGASPPQSPDKTLKLKLFGVTFQRSRKDSLSNLAGCGICRASRCPEVCTSPCNSLGRSLLLGLAMASARRRWWTSSTTFVFGNRYNRFKTDRDSSIWPHSISWKANLRGFEMLSHLSRM